MSGKLVLWFFLVVLIILVPFSSLEVLGLVIGILVYLGPVVPMAVTLLFWRVSAARFRRNLLLLAMLSAIQGAAYLPFLYDVATKQQDALYDLIFPLCTGALLFVSTLVYSVIECIRLENMGRQGRG